MQSVIIGAGASGLLHALAFRASGHVAQAEALARDGRTVFVEKPVATNTAELERLRDAGRCVPIVQWRAGRALRALRRSIAHGELGPAPVISCDLAWGRDDAYFDARRVGWGSGALLSIGIHAVDALVWALGRRVDAVSGMVNDRLEAGSETAAVLLVRFSGGALASLRISLDGGGDTTRIVACGRGVTATIEGPEADPTGRPLRFFAQNAATRDRLEALEKDTSGALGPPLLVPYIGAAVAALRDGAAPGEVEGLPSIGDVVDAHAAILAVYEARRAPNGA